MVEDDSLFEIDFFFTQVFVNVILVKAVSLLSANHFALKRVFLDEKNHDETYTDDRSVDNPNRGDTFGISVDDLLLQR